MTTINNSKSFDAEILDLMREHRLPFIAVPPLVQITNAKQKIIDLCDIFLSRFNRRFEWRKEYQPIADWLENNENKGLFVYGNCGVGKTMICRYAIPAIILSEYRKVMRPVDAVSLGDRLDDVKKMPLLMIDDVGAELGDSVKYGERRSPFSEIMDNAEKKGTLLVITSNLDGTKLEERYGSRTLDRVKSMCKRVMITGKSMRV